jgi:hypothetical protein
MVMDPFAWMFCVFVMMVPIIGMDMCFDYDRNHMGMIKELTEACLLWSNKWGHRSISLIID